MLRRIIRITFKQYNIAGSWLGAFNVTLGKLMFYGGVFGWVSSIGTFYLVGVKPWLAQHGVVIATSVLVTGAFTVVSVGLLVVYKFVYPSEIRFGQGQNYAHGSPVKKDFDEMRGRLIGLTEQYDGVRTMLDEQGKVLEKLSRDYDTELQYRAGEMRKKVLENHRRAVEVMRRGQD